MYLMDGSELLTLCLCWNLVWGTETLRVLDPGEAAAAEGEKGCSHRHKSRSLTSGSCCKEFLDCIGSYDSCRECTNCIALFSARNTEREDISTYIGVLLRLPSDSLMITGRVPFDHP
jgi:hypothetical protein